MAGSESMTHKLFMAFTGTNKDKAGYYRSDNNWVFQRGHGSTGQICCHCQQTRRRSYGKYRHQQCQTTL